MSARLSLVLAAAATLLLNFPLILIWDRDIEILGLPLLPVALFAIWALAIAALALAGERRSARHLPPPG